MLIKIARDFSCFPAGRVREDGPNSAQRFREEFLIPAIEKNESVIVDLEGTIGYASNFLEEAFGRLTPVFGKEALHKKLTIKSKCHSYLTEIWQYIDANSL